MNKEELNAKLGYNKELLYQLATAFDLEEDYNQCGWDKLFEICRYIYNLEQQCQKQKEVINKAIECLDLWQIPECDKETMREIQFSANKQNILDILKEVSK